MHIKKIYNRIAILLVIYMILVYIIQNLVVIDGVASYFWNTWIQPISWLGIVLLLGYWISKTHSLSKLRYQKNVIAWAFNCGVCYIIVNILGGVLQGFGKSPYSHTAKAIITNIITTGIILVGRECIRAYLINSLCKKKNTRIIVSIVALMTFTQITLISFTSIMDLKSLTIFLAEKGLPILCQNILATYLVLYGGAISSIIYLGIIEVFMMLSPILPNMGWLGKGVIGIIIPSLALVVVIEAYAKLTKRVKAYRSKDESALGWIPTAVISIVIIWFVVGVFPVYPSAIVTGSMEPMIKPGDVVLIEKVKDIKDINDLKIGDVIQFKRDNLLITHRILEIVEDEGQMKYRTKGDNNSIEDSELVKSEAIKGTVFKVVPKVGWPTLLFRSSSPEVLEQVEF